MKILGIETSTGVNSVAIVTEEKVLCEISLDAGPTHSSYLMNNIELILRYTSLKISDIEGIAVSCGPGSFTGLRVGISLAKGLAYASKKSIVGIPSLDALAYKNYGRGVIVCPMTDAKKNEVYFSLYTNHNNKFRKLIRERSSVIEDAVSLIKEYYYETIIFAGDGSVKYMDYLKKKFKRFNLAPVSSRFPSASAVADLGIIRIKNNDIDDFNQLLPFYLRESDAKMRKKSNAEAKQNGRRGFKRSL